MKELILGGVRSGKSRMAEQRALASGRDVTYIATATAGDEAMSARIAQHREFRPANWLTVEEPLALATTLQQQAHPLRCVIVDCITLWLTNWLWQDNSAAYDAQRATLLQILPTLPGHIILVSNETSMGIIPLGELTRRYGDEAGSLHQALAAQCSRVTLMVAGLPLTLKELSPCTTG